MIETHESKLTIRGRKIVVAGTGMPDVIQTIAAINATNTNDIVLLGFLDDNPAHRSRNLYGYDIVGGFAWIKQNPTVKVFNSIARTTKLRHETTDILVSMGAQLTSLIHPTASVKHSNIGIGCYVGKNVHLEVGSEIGDGTIVLANATVAHDSKIGRNCFIGSGVHIQGHVLVEDNVFIAAGTVIHPNIIVRENVSIDCNGVITSNTKRGGAYFHDKMRYLG